MSKIPIITRWKQYFEITQMYEIVRRYFVMNAFDGVLTSLGIIIANFALFLGDQQISSKSILITGYATTIAIGISGLAGAYLAETAELRRSNIEIREAMAVFIDDDKSSFSNNEVYLHEEDYYPTVDVEDDELNTINGEEVESIDIDPLPRPIKTTPTQTAKQLRKKLRFRFGKQKEEKSFTEKAESFSSTIAAVIDGFSPALGSVFGLIPFFFGLTIPIFVISFIIEVIILFGLGAYLAKISGDKIWIYGLAMVATGILTSIIGYLISLIGGN
ncbi:MAG: VIT1/CCC1 transporter family protein [Candidatus Lokiarchaeota archaeon]|nr:VIT1/CCC1 transporter family protein [Candidatus Lokiarchaeota archaeon]